MRSWVAASARSNLGAMINSPGIPQPGRWSQENRSVKVIFGFIVSSRSTWVAGDLASKTKTKTETK